MSILTIKALPALSDNYIWVIHNETHAIVIDPGSALPVNNYITANGLTLAAIFLTHSHSDHVSGVAKIEGVYSGDVPIYGLSSYATEEFEDNITIEGINNISIKLFKTPGHTFDGVSFMIEFNNKRHFFCGDTLFSLGCGRVFTNDYNLMLSTLKFYKELLNDDDLIYPAHEYTMLNLAFAKQLQKCYSHGLNAVEVNIKNKLSTDGISLPTMYQLEREFNPFLKFDDKEFVEKFKQLLLAEDNEKLGMKLNDINKLDKDQVLNELGYFTILRNIRNQFQL